VQEGLTNIGKHANASRASVALDFRPEAPDQAMPGRRWLALTIEDDGCGRSDHGTAVEGEGESNGKGAGSEGGLGLIGMRERAAALGGQLNVVQLDHGFRLQAMIPIGARTETTQ